ncbi:hypothetical protein D915_006945 [Fasciola hepatica]|uniref:Uncharacterized protein n=1 Tax=Fasciola hepatica TaxID=6192 RepID=A0A4E0R611_FASHE|nr:hypothetical protein D915_006945 [Fasciola hepatica]
MNEVIAKTIEKLEETGTYIRDTKIFHQVDEGDHESTLEYQKRLLQAKKSRLEQRRKEAIRKLEEQGFPVLRPKVQPNADYRDECKPPEDQSTTRMVKIKMFGPNPEKPQNSSPYNMSSDCKRFYNAPAETKGIPIPLDEPYVSDRAIRAKISAQSKGNSPETVPRRKPISSVFPYMPYQIDDTLTDEEKMAKKYLYTSTYQDNYGKSADYWEHKYRRVFPLRTLETLPDPLRKIAGSSDHYPATDSWQPENFNADRFDALLPRYSHINEPRPYEFSTYAPRIEQIPSYSGCHGTEDCRVEDDNPYKMYRPLTKPRTVVPSRPFINPQQNMVGYTGCVVDHEKRLENPPWPWESVKGYF